MMHKSKKGVTLVELVICCAIIVMLGGACSAVLASGSRIFNTSSHTANAQLDANVIQNYMMNLIPSADEMRPTTLEEARENSVGNCLFFDNDVFTIRINGKNTTIRSVDEFTYDIIRAGDPSSSTARAQFVYTITLSDKNTLTGGFVLSNMTYADAQSSFATEDDEPISGDIKTEPFYFNKIS